MNRYDKVQCRMQEIGQRIKKERIKKGYKNQSEFMEALNYTAPNARQTCTNWEKGKRLPNLDDLLNMCILFDCEMGYLLCEEGYEGKTRAITDIQNLTGLSARAIKQLQFFNNNEPQSGKSAGFTMLTNHKAMEWINAFLEHPRLGSFIYNINGAMIASKLQPSEYATGGDLITAENAASHIGSIILNQEEAINYYRQEALNALRDIVYDLVPEQKEDANNGDNN